MLKTFASNMQVDVSDDQFADWDSLTLDFDKRIYYEGTMKKYQLDLLDDWKQGQEKSQGMQQIQAIQRRPLRRTLMAKFLMLKAIARFWRSSYGFARKRCLKVIML